MQDEGAEPSLAGVALAHAVGHSLGFEDDANGADHDCGCPDATCVMGRHLRSVWQSRRYQKLDTAGFVS